MSALLACELELADGGKRPLEDDEIFAYCRLIILAGGGTTWRQLGITLYQLLSNYHFWEACREDRSLIEPAIEEGARYMPTDPVFQRRMTENGMEIIVGSPEEFRRTIAEDRRRWGEVIRGANIRAD